MFTNFLVVLSTVATLLMGCGAASKSPDGKVPTPAPTDTPSIDPSGAPSAGALVLAPTLDIPQDSSSIVVTPSNGAGLSAGIKASSFVTVSNSGQVGSLNIFVDSGAKLTQTTMTPVAKEVFQTPTWFVFVYATGSAPCDLVLMRKSDKKLYCGGVAYNPSNKIYTGGRGLYQWDLAGNLYLLQLQGVASISLVKVTLSDPANPTRTTLHDFVNGSFGFVVNGQGDAFILEPLSITGNALIKKSGGGIQNVAGAAHVAAMLGADGAFYWIKYGSLDIKKLTRGSDGSFIETTHAAGAVLGQAANLTLGGICSTSTNIFGGDIGAIPSSNAYRFIASAGSLDLASQGYGSWSDLRCGGSKVYILGQNASGAGMIKAFDDGGNTWTTLLAAGEYTVRNFEVSASGDVFFDGLRNSDGKKVFAKVAASGGAPIIISESFFEPQRLLPLN